MSGLRALVIANGEPPSPRLMAGLLEGEPLVVAADGGSRAALALGVKPAFVVGDLDSVDEAIRAQLPASAFRRDPDPETTDLEKSIRFALAQGATTIDVAGAGGRRADHAFANLSVLLTFRGQAAISIIDEQFAVKLVDGETPIEGAAGTVVSLVAIGRCTGVTTTGLRWELRDETLDFSPRGVHNEVRQQPALVRAATGDLLLFQGRWIEKHG